MQLVVVDSLPDYFLSSAVARGFLVRISREDWNQFGLCFSNSINGKL